MCTLSIWGSWGLAGFTLKRCCGQRLFTAESHVVLSRRTSRCWWICGFCWCFILRVCEKGDSNVSPQEWPRPEATAGLLLSCPLLERREKKKQSSNWFLGHPPYTSYLVTNWSHLTHHHGISWVSLLLLTLGEQRENKLISGHGFSIQMMKLCGEIKVCQT